MFVVRDTGMNVVLCSLYQKVKMFSYWKRLCAAISVCNLMCIMYCVTILSVYKADIVLHVEK